MKVGMEQEQSRLRTMPPSDAAGYNYPRFRPNVLGKDVKLIRHPEGPRLGELAPDFELKDTDDKSWSLSDLRGRPVILVIGSGTCPLTQGSLPGLIALHDEYKDRCTWLMLYVREAHPGENMPAHHDYGQKRAQAEYFMRDSGPPWPILIDELDGRVHKAYGLLPNSTFLLDADGRVAFVGEISHAPTLRRALEHLFGQGMRGPVPEGDDKALHMLGPTAYGWDAIRRGGNVSTRDVATRMPPLAMNLWMGSKMQALLAPLAGRSRPLERRTRIALAVAGVAGVAGAAAILTAVVALSRPRMPD
jgi:thiol-disulfide isomerase/thioredoxin